MKYKVIFLLGFGLLLNAVAAQDCSDFAQGILEILKTGEDSLLEAYLMPIEEQRSMLSWPKNEAATETLTSMRDSLRFNFMNSIRTQQDQLTTQGLDIYKAFFLGCSRGNGRMSNVELTFGVDTVSFSLLIPTIETNRTYVLAPIGNDDRPQEAASSTISFNGIEYVEFLPRQSEIDLATSYLRNEAEHLFKKGVLLTPFFSGLQNEAFGTGILFIFIDQTEEQVIKVVVNLETGTYLQLEP